MPSDSAMRAAKEIMLQPETRVLWDSLTGASALVVRQKFAEIIDREMIPVSLSVDGARHILESYGWTVIPPKDRT